MEQINDAAESCCRSSNTTTPPIRYKRFRFGCVSYYGWAKLKKLLSIPKDVRPASQNKRPDPPQAPKIIIIGERLMALLREIPSRTLIDRLTSVWWISWGNSLAICALIRPTNRTTRRSDRQKKQLASGNGSPDRSRTCIYRLGGDRSIH